MVLRSDSLPGYLQPVIDQRCLLPLPSLYVISYLTSHFSHLFSPCLCTYFISHILFQSCTVTDKHSLVFLRCRTISLSFIIIPSSPLSFSLSPYELNYYTISHSYCFSNHLYSLSIFPLTFSIIDSFTFFTSNVLIFICPPVVPSPPTFFTKVVNSTAVQVLWELPSKPGKAEGFRLTYRRVPYTDFQGPVQFPCHVNAHTISRLGE